jgi:hypothetical protein
LEWLDEASSCFQVGNETGGNETDESLDVWMSASYIPWGDGVSVYLESYNLSIGTNYSLQYVLYSATGIGLDAYYWNWYAANESSIELATWANLSVGNYCLNATLKVFDAAGSITVVAEEQQCFVIYMPEYSEWINILTPGSTYDENISYHLNYASSDIVMINLTAYDLDPTKAYNLTYDICRFDSSDNCLAFANGDVGFDGTDPYNNIYSFQIVNGSPMEQDIVTFSEGCYVISSYLFNSNNTTAVAMDLGLTFTVGSPSVCEDYDGDGVNNTDDSFPADSSEWEDTDGDGVGNNADSDDDGDGLNDTADAFPLDPTEGTDTDGDGIGNNADFDDDGDGIADAIDNCPYVQNSDQSDADGDGIGTACDGNENTGGNNTGNNTSDDPCQAGVIDGENLPNGACCSSGSQCASEYCNYSNGTCENDPWNNGTDDNNTGDNNTDDPPNDPPGDDNNTGSGDNGDDDDDDDSSSGGGIPGFTSIIATVSLLGAAILARRKENSL